jgi:inner membrane protein
VAITRNDATGTYDLRRGALSLAPALMPVSHCPLKLGGPGTAAGPGPIAWTWEEHGQVDELRARRAASCRLDAWLRFARAPSFQDGAATDVRFGAPGSANFSTLPDAMLAGTPCPVHVPEWGYPRADLLGLR